MAPRAGWVAKTTAEAVYRAHASNEENPRSVPGLLPSLKECSKAPPGGESDVKSAAVTSSRSTFTFDVVPEKSTVTTAPECHSDGRTFSSNITESASSRFDPRRLSSSASGQPASPGAEVASGAWGDAKCKLRQRPHALHAQSSHTSAELNEWLVHQGSHFDSSASPICPEWHCGSAPDAETGEGGGDGGSEHQEQPWHRHPHDALASGGIADDARVTGLALLCKRQPAVLTGTAATALAIMRAIAVVLASHPAHVPAFARIAAQKTVAEITATATAGAALRRLLFHDAVGHALLNIGVLRIGRDAPTRARSRLLLRLLLRTHAYL
eukprot:scaffold55551_cov29-Tisochrysis_lutea.AAC.4